MWLTPTSHRNGKKLKTGMLTPLVGLILLASIFPPAHSSSLEVAVRASEVYPWLYSRGRETPEVDEATVELVAVGDILLGRGVPDAEGALEHAAPWLGSADLATANLEGVLESTREVSPNITQSTAELAYRLVQPPNTAQVLKEAGFDLLNLANNHALDLGSAGLAETISQIRAAGLQPFGFSEAPGSGAALQIIEVKGVRLAFLGFSMLPTLDSAPEGSAAPVRYQPEAAAAAVKAARRDADAVVISIHWGREYQTRVDISQERAARVLYEAGADLVLGHHPHTVQGTQVLYPGEAATKGIMPTSSDPAQAAQASGQNRTGFVAYSLGNFVFDQFSGETRNGLALRVLLDRHGVRGVQALPLHAGIQPHLLEMEEAVELFERVQPPPEFSMLITCDLITCQASETTLEQALASKKATLIDLSGDGKPETVRIPGERVEIIHEGQIAWSSPPEWRVLDIASGDPNDDGRYEILLSLRKADPTGVQRSHPFIIGYRGGRYKLLWGGSALSTPIGEVEIGDVDGNQRQELVVLEELEEDERTLSIWRWHGWGYTLMWRSQPGRYTNLRLAQHEGSQPAAILVDIRP